MEVLTAARHEAERRRIAADAQAQTVLAEARATVTSLRTAETQQLVDDANHERDELLATAQLEVQRIEQSVTERLPVLVPKVVEGIFAMGAETS
jgi:F0F1-type ATP synthase membrane subunit b/b'